MIPVRNGRIATYDAYDTTDNHEQTTKPKRAGSNCCQTFPHNEALLNKNPGTDRMINMIPDQNHGV